jgi:hypothetical protein
MAPAELGDTHGVRRLGSGERSDGRRYGAGSRRRAGVPVCAGEVRCEAKAPGDGASRKGRRGASGSGVAAGESRLPAARSSAARHGERAGWHAQGRRGAADDANPWPGSIRVKKIENADPHRRGLGDDVELQGPDGRRTWKCRTLDGESAIRWRRVSTHGIFKHP